MTRTIRRSLPDALPTVDAVLSLDVAELAGVILKILPENLQGRGEVHLSNARSFTVDAATQTSGSPYRDRRDEVALAVAEAFQWLIVNGLLVPSPTSGEYGWHVLSRRGRILAQSEEDFRRYAAAATFPKAMLHPKIADKAWTDLARGDLADAVFYAFRTVEEEVRDAGGFALTDVGMPLMRLAFDADKGPLTDMNQPRAEREALCHMVAGAIGSYKNPHSHRTVTITDPVEAQEMVLLATHLLRIVDSRRKAPPPE